ncbi:MAG: hypothetical protein K6F56_02110 [Oscillospiraceae bacterium]|nr:hypothetical protein [Oscillospiraceae bacterium]
MNSANYYDTRDRYQNLKCRFPGEVLVLGSEAEDGDRLRTFDDSAEFLRFVANGGCFYTNAKGEVGFIINMFDLLRQYRLVKIEPLAWLVK